MHFVAGLDEDMRMPPKGEPLSAEQIGLLRKWIDDGAQWPDSASAKVVDKKDWWSLKPVVKPVVKPALPTAAGNPIDAFISAKLTEKGLATSPEADAADALPPAVFRSDRTAADAGGDGRVRRGQDLRAPTNDSWTGCSLRRATANAGRGIGSMWSTSARRMATTRTSRGRMPGRIATT